MRDIIKKLIDERTLRTPHIIKAFKSVNRRDFVPLELLGEEGMDVPLPIGEGQTISQPFTVAFMMELLQPMPGQRVLDVGFGSGWTTALLATIVGRAGHVYAIERVPELCEFGRKNVAKYKFEHVMMVCGDGTKGMPQYAPFDRIMVAAAAKIIPPSLGDQLATGGRMVIPTQSDDIRVIDKNSQETYKETVYPGFVFVPLISDE